MRFEGTLVCLFEDHENVKAFCEFFHGILFEIMVVFVFGFFKGIWECGMSVSGYNGCCPWPCMDDGRSRGMAMGFRVVGAESRVRRYGIREGFGSFHFCRAKMH